MDEAKRELVAAWLTKAQHDLASARKLAGPPEPLFETALYHCQQAAEKAVKGLLLFQEQDFEKTHATSEICDRPTDYEIKRSVAPGLFVKAGDIVNAFFEFLEPPRILASDVLKKAISKGVRDGQFAWFNGSTALLGADSKLQVSRDEIVFGNPLSEDEIDFDSGWLLMPVALPAPTQAPQPSSQIQEQPGGVLAGTGGRSGVQPVAGVPATGQPGGQNNDKPKVVSFKFKATRDQIFKAFPAIANLADKSDGGQISVQIEGTNKNGFDPAWLRNAVEEPLQESNVDTHQTPP